MFTSNFMFIISKLMKIRNNQIIQSKNTQTQDNNNHRISNVTITNSIDNHN
ncbi:hypothetical protein Hanom_Chr01g00011981 [Helianthus anomalus]